MHIHHANKIDPLFVAKIHKLYQAGVQLLNQSVLLKGVNDNREARINLSEALNHANILPCYLFLLDKVQGAQPFDISLTKLRCFYMKFRVNYLVI